MTTLTQAELFDPAFLEAVEGLRLFAARVPSGGRFASQRSRALGSGIEFRDFRPYTAGDDLRAVDWNIYRRLGRVFVRLFEEEQDLPVYLLPDLSTSGYVDEGAGLLRAHVGLRAALALGAVALAQHDSVGVFPIGADVTTCMRPTSGANRLVFLAKRLAELTPGAGTDLAHSFERFGAMNLRRGLAVVISDFFDPAGLDGVLRAAGRLRHRVLFVQLWRASDAEPDPRAFQGDLRLVDAEGAVTASGHLDMFVDDGVRARYRAAYDAFAAQLTAFALERGLGHLLLDVERDVPGQLRALLMGDARGRFEA